MRKSIIYESFSVGRCHNLGQVTILKSVREVIKNHCDIRQVLFL